MAPRFVFFLGHHRVQLTKDDDLIKAPHPCARLAIISTWNESSLLSSIVAAIRPLESDRWCGDARRLPATNRERPCLSDVQKLSEAR